jgi:hypothetical protein
MTREEQFQDWAKPPDVTEEWKSRSDERVSFLITLFAMPCALVGGLGANPGRVPPGLPFTLKWRNAVSPLMSVGFAADGGLVWTVGDKGTILTTRDGGDRWEPQTSGAMNNLGGIAFAADRRTAARRLYAPARHGNYRGSRRGRQVHARLRNSTMGDVH